MLELKYTKSTRPSAITKTVTVHYISPNAYYNLGLALTPPPPHASQKQQKPNVLSSSPIFFFSCSLPQPLCRPHAFQHTSVLGQDQLYNARCG